MFESIINAIKAAFRYIVNLVRKVIHGVLDFFKEVVTWFKSLSLNPQEDTPFIADASEFKKCSKLHRRKTLVSLKEFIMRKQMRLQLTDTWMLIVLTQKLRKC